jgi:hypothetical protein
LFVPYRDEVVGVFVRFSTHFEEVEREI